MVAAIQLVWFGPLISFRPGDVDFQPIGFGGPRETASRRIARKLGHPTRIIRASGERQLEAADGPATSTASGAGALYDLLSLL